MPLIVHLFADSHEIVNTRIRLQRNVFAPPKDAEGQLILMGRPGNPVAHDTRRRDNQDVTQEPLQTARLDLIPLTDEHLADEIELDADPEVTHYIWGRARTREEVIASHSQRMERGRQVDGLGFWAGFGRDEPGCPFVGWWILGPLHGPDQGDWRTTPGVAELGYRLHRRHWRKGLASEGSRELLRHAFEDLGLRRVIAQAVTDNVGSRAVMESVGMTFVRSWGEPDGEVEYALTRHAWFSRQLTRRNHPE